MKLTLALAALLSSSFVYASCPSLEGERFVGVAGQGRPHTPGCEGCDNPGFIDFLPDHEAELVWVGSDIGQSCEYSAMTNQIDLKCGESFEARLTLSPDCHELTAQTGAKFDRR